MLRIYLLEFRFHNQQAWQLLSERENGETVIFMDEQDAEIERDRLAKEGDLKGAEIRVVDYLRDPSPAQTLCECGDTYPIGQGHRGHCSARCHDFFWGGETEADFIDQEEEDEVEHHGIL